MNFNRLVDKLADWCLCVNSETKTSSRIILITLMIMVILCVLVFGLITLLLVSPFISIIMLVILVGYWIWWTIT